MNRTRRILCVGGVVRMSTTALTSWSTTPPSSSAASSTMPQSLFGYDIIDVIGEGAGSTIYAVSQPDSKQLYALKHVIRNKDKDIRFIEQLESEYNIGKKLTHANVRRP